MRFFEFQTAPPALTRQVYGALLNSRLSTSRGLTIQQLLADDPQVTVGQAGVLDSYIMSQLNSLTGEYWHGMNPTGLLSDYTMQAAKMSSRPVFAFHSSLLWSIVKPRVVELIEAQLAEWGVTESDERYAVGREWRQRNRWYDNTVRTNNYLPQTRNIGDGPTRHALALKTLEV